VLVPAVGGHEEEMRRPGSLACEEDLRPFGDQAAAMSSPLAFVNLRTFDPSTFMTKTSAPPRSVSYRV